MTTYGLPMRQEWAKKPSSYPLILTHLIGRHEPAHLGGAGELAVDEALDLAPRPPAIALGRRIDNDKDRNLSCSIEHKFKLFHNFSRHPVTCSSCSSLL